MAARNSTRVACAAVASLTLFVLAAGAYNPPGGPSPMTANLNSPNTHGAILDKAIEILEADGFKQMADYYRGQRQPLFNGLRQADKEAGDITIEPHSVSKAILSVINAMFFNAVGELKQEIPASTLFHFYNPDTGKGLQLFRGAGFLSTLKGIAIETSILPWQWYTLFGPMPRATDMCDYFYARAVEEMRQGRSAQAMEFLGIAAHLVQDLTVPQHATDRHGGFPGARHLEYETYCSDHFGKAASIMAGSAKDLGSLYTSTGSYSPGYLVHYAAAQSAPHIAKVTRPATPGVAYALAEDVVAPTMTALAAKLTAALLKRFWENWENEAFTLMALKINRAAARDHDIDSVGDADLYAQVRVGDRWFPSTGTISGSDDVRPQVHTPYNWFFPNWIPGRPDAVHLKIKLVDEDGGLNGGDDRVDITPVKGYALDLDYWTKTGAMIGDIKLDPGFGEYTVWGNGNDNGQVWFSVERYPVTEKVTTQYCAAGGRVLGVDGQPARGSWLFFRPAVSGGKWQRVIVNENGYYNLPAVKAVEYEFRPAGSRYSFAGVPRIQKLLPGKNTIDFKAQKQPLKLLSPGALTAIIQSAASGRKAEFQLSQKMALAVGSAATRPTIVSPETAAARTLLREDAITVKLPAADLGVRNNGLGYSEQGTLFVHLHSFLNEQTKQPLKDLSSVKVLSVPVVVGGKKEASIPIVQGVTTGPGTAGATLRVTLQLGNPDVGFAHAGSVTAKTDASGNAAFVVRAGSHVENARIVVEVLANPVNPWCTPKFLDDDLMLFSPAAKGDDFGPGQPYSIALAPGPLRPGRQSPHLATATALFGMTGGRRATAMEISAASAELDRREFVETIARHAALWEARRTAIQASPGRLNLPAPLKRPGRLKLPGR